MKASSFYPESFNYFFREADVHVTFIGMAILGRTTPKFHGVPKPVFVFDQCLRITARKERQTQGEVNEGSR